MSSRAIPVVDLTNDDENPATRPAQRKRNIVEQQPAKRPVKRRRGVSENDEDDDAACGMPAKPPIKKKQTKEQKDDEKRLRRFRSHAPSAYGDIKHRALTQRMFVVDRQRLSPRNTVGDDQHAHPTEVLSIAGTTGNIYTVTIDRIPTCDCPYALKGHQCKHVIYALARVLKAPPHLEYQLAFLSSELRDIFANASPLPSETADESAQDGNRKPLEGEDCPICCEEFSTESVREKIVYCTAACGNNIHRECFDQWARTKAGTITCPFCRTPWQSDVDAVKSVAKVGRVNAEGYVNVASQLGLSGRRDYSTYNEYWVRRQGYDNW